MAFTSRRLFLGTSLSTLGTGSILLGQDPRDAAAGAFLRRPNVEFPAFEPTTLFLTWHRDPTTTMVVQWIGTRGETADTTIQYTTDPAAWAPKPPAARTADAPPAAAPTPATSATPAPVTGTGAGTSAPASAAPKAKTIAWQSQKPILKPYPMTDFQVFRAELTGLTPGTDYAFKIGKSSGVYRFRTMPAKATDTITFVSGGDSGINSAAVANNLMAARQNPHFAVIGGDLGYDNGRSVEVSIAFIRNWSKTMIDSDGRLIPMVPCIGNHEVDGGYTRDRAKSPFFLALFDGLYPSATYNTLDFGDYLSLVLLDSGHLSPIGGEQALWLEKTLRAREDLPHTIAVNHVPAYPSNRNPLPTPAKGDKKASAGTGEENRKYWVPLFDKYRVPLVLEHHDHTFKRTKPLLGGLPHPNGVLYLGDGSWGRLRSPRPTDDLHVMLKTSSDYHITLHKIQGQERFHMAMDERSRVMDVSHTGQRKRGIVAVQG
jgi:hypothetical protein